MLPVPTPSPTQTNRFTPQRAGFQGAPHTFRQEDSIKGYLSRCAKREEWAALELRQDWADEGFMRAHLQAAGIRIPDNNEPATPARLGTMLRRAGVLGQEAQEAVGTTLAGFLGLNPKLPLWAASALVLEATGRFTAQAFQRMTP